MPYSDSTHTKRPAPTYRPLIEEVKDMKRRLPRFVAPVALVLGCVSASGGVAVSTATAGTVAAVVAPQTSSWSGTVATVDTKKDRFTMASHKKTYTVVYTSKTVWKKGSSADLKKDVKVTVSGTLAKKTITAKSISA
jgi:hypothetical protein